MSMEQEGNANRYLGIDEIRQIVPGAVFDNSSAVLASDNDLIGLCAMCKKCRLNCENFNLRSVEVPLALGDDPKLEVRREIKRLDGRWERIPTGTKWADGVEVGIFTSEKDVPIPFICDWFDPKNPG